MGTDNERSRDQPAVGKHTEGTRIHSRTPGGPSRTARRFPANEVRLQLHALAYNLANFLRTLATPGEIERWSLTSLRERLIKTGARLVRHGRYAIFQMAEVAIPRRVFAAILTMMNALRGPPRSGAPA